MFIRFIIYLLIYVITRYLYIRYDRFSSFLNSLRLGFIYSLIAISG